MDYNQPNIIQLINLRTQLDNTNLGQSITKQCLTRNSAVFPP